MKIAVLSDTHLEDPSPPLIHVYEDRLKNMDIILHLGDFTGERVWLYLQAHTGFYEVAGNMDRGEWADSLPRKRVVQVGGVKIGMLHGFGFGDPKRYATDVFAPGLDLICFGHSHRYLWLQRPGRIPLLNPGSFSLPRAGYPGFAVFEVRRGRLTEPVWERVCT
ncbi:MAG: YfcE family phosphodiesterase [Desulfohalobiaceae bacterium]|nr:YfcE family phosphodiesterase [Desulfohalobiaceae bacterium]